VSLILPTTFSKTGRSQLLVFSAENVPVDSMAITRTAIATGNQTLSHQRQPPSNSLEDSNRAENTERMFLKYQACGYSVARAEFQT
jgi:hypothetical protein